MWQCCERRLPLDGRPLVMGILNVTPDSFSDGGKFDGTDRAVARALQLLDDGADILDVGGESTRPGAVAVPVNEELARVVPVIRAIAADRPEAVLSVDTTKASVARAAVDAGACIINDVSALTHDERMPGVAAETGAGVVLMHMRGTPGTMQNAPEYGDVVQAVSGYLKGRIRDLVSVGVSEESLAVDPGIGFGKTVRHNLDLLAGLAALRATGRPVVVGLSRKSFLGSITGQPVDKRLAGSLAALAFCVMDGVNVMRVHDVRESADAIRVLMELMQGKGRGKWTG